MAEMKHLLQTIVGGEDAPVRCGWCGWALPIESVHRLAYCTQEGSACPSCRDEHWNHREGWGNWRDALDDAIYAHMEVEQAYDYIVSACQHFGFNFSPSFVWDVCEQALSPEAWEKRENRRQNPASPQTYTIWNRWHQWLSFPGVSEIERVIIRGVRGLPIAEAVVILHKHFARIDREREKWVQMREGLEKAQAYLEKKRHNGRRVVVSEAKTAVREALSVL